MTDDELIGKTVIVGVSYYDENDQPLGQKQFHGKIVSVSYESGIRYMDEKTHEERVLPPRKNALFPASKGQYRECSTRKVVKNPDFISLWRVKKLAGNDDDWEWQPYRVTWSSWEHLNETQ